MIKVSLILYWTRLFMTDCTVSSSTRYNHNEDNYLLGQLADEQTYCHLLR